MKKNHSKPNCWEFNRCDRRAECPAATDHRLNGIHGGTNAGRACWIVAGTFCNQKAPRTLTGKIKNCTYCSFYQTLRKQEGANYLMILDLMKKLQRKHATATHAKN